MTMLLALVLLLSILSVSALAYDIPNVTYRSCYDGDTCRFDIPKVHPFSVKTFRFGLLALIPLTYGGNVTRKSS